MKKKIQIIICIIIILVGVVITVIDLIPYKYSSSDFLKTIYSGVTKEDRALIKINNLQIEKESSKGPIKVFLLSYNINNTKTEGVAVFVKHALLQHYKVHDLFLKSDNNYNDYYTAVSTFTKIYLVSVKKHNGICSVDITLDKNITMDKLTGYSIFIVIILIGWIIKSYIFRDEKKKIV